ncbi:MAG: serine/threonine-protein kinase [Planctomycetota bacterium]|nr:serine/threonine-protein kinase [Planctomycetota bacterium]
MATRTYPREPTPAESIFVAWLADRSRDFAQVVRAHPEHSPELRALHALWLRLEPVLSLAGVQPSEAIERLKPETAPQPAPLDRAPTPLDLGSKSAGKSATSDLLRRLDQKRRTGRYRLEGEVARGGMGAILRVWDEDIRRHLAMKVVLGQAAESGETPPVESRVLARFLEEAQITGQLDHPGIVPVHELGLDADGRVYFTMKLVKGRHLGAIYDLVAAGHEGWNETRALGVLLKACEAVAYAHAKDVIHRDLKPANVMVGDFGEVYVMDWGLARVLGRVETPEQRAASAPAAVRTERVQERESSPASSFMTMDGEVVGTPAYMPPEQARGDIDALSARSDVYALGAMLYHLLAGAPPYTIPGETAGGRDIWKRALAGPPTPLETIAPRAPTELVAICDKAMAREPADRYASVLELAEDLRAFLEGRVVGAFEGGALAEARKWVRRNKALAASLAAAVLALGAGLVASLVLSARVSEKSVLAEERRVEAETSAAEARRQALVAGEVNRFLNEDLLAAVSPDQLGIEVKVRAVLDEAAKRLGGRFDSEPSVESALRLTIGSTYQNLGEFAAARENLERALELRRAHEGPDSEATLAAMQAVANVWGQMGLRRDSIALHRECIALAERLLGPEAPATLSSKNDLAVVLLRDGQTDAARDLYTSVLGIQDRVLGPDHRDSLATRDNLAVVDQQQGRFEDAARGHLDVYERRRKALGEKHPDTLLSLANLTTTLLDLGRIEEAEARSREALVLTRAVNGPDHLYTGRMEGNLGVALVRGGRPDEAEPHLVESLRILRNAFGEEHEDVSLARSNLATALGAQGRVQEATDIEREVLEVRRRTLPPDHSSILESMDSLAVHYLELERYAEAEPLFRETLEGRTRVLGRDHARTIATNENLSNCLYKQGRYAECAAILREVLEARRRVLGDAHPDVAKTTYNLALLTMSAGDPAAALPLFEDALRRVRGQGGDAAPGLLAACLRSLGDLHLKRKEYPAAIEAHREALVEHRRDVDEDDELSGFLLHHEPESAIFGAHLYPLELASAGQTGEKLASDLRQKRVRDQCVHHPRAALEFRERTLRTVGPEGEPGTSPRQLLADLYERWGKPEEAAKWR